MTMTIWSGESKDLFKSWQRTYPSVRDSAVKEHGVKLRPREAVLFNLYCSRKSLKMNLVYEEDLAKRLTSDNKTV